ncbi:hypothetical protein ES703_57593 [subsurface metagenome]
MTLKFQDLKEVKTVKTDEEANELLSEGWVLISCGVSRRMRATEPLIPWFQFGRVANIEKKD